MTQERLQRLVILLVHNLLVLWLLMKLLKLSIHPYTNQNLQLDTRAITDFLQNLKAIIS